MKLIGKLQDGKEFLKKGHGEGEEPFEFKTDEGNNTSECFFFFFFLFVFFWSFVVLRIDIVGQSKSLMGLIELW